MNAHLDTIGPNTRNADFSVEPNGSSLAMSDVLAKASRTLGPREFLIVLLQDQKKRFDQGDFRSAQDYLAAFPQLGQNSHEAIVLLGSECFLLAKRGKLASFQDYQNHFPQFANEFLPGTIYEQILSDSSASATYKPEEKSLRERIPLALAETAVWTEDPTLSPPAPPLIQPHCKKISSFPETSPTKDRLPRQSPSGYELVGLLGRGGMGVVYKARQISLNRYVALKMIRSGEHASSNDRIRFRREAEAVAQLKHSNIVQIYEIGEYEGEPFLCLEYVAGGTLSQKTGGIPQPPREAALMIESLARAIHFAHEQGVIHRDLKPSNIFIDENEIPKIGDFGLAKNLKSNTNGPDFDLTSSPVESLHTNSGDLLGTPSYMAPEQARSRGVYAAPISSYTDVYSLGSILYEMLTGRPPFLGSSSIETLLQLLSHEPAPPSKLTPKLSLDLEIICLKCLSKHSKRRYQTGLELADDLRRWLDGEPIKARRTSDFEQLCRWAKRKPALASLSALALALSLICLVGFSYFFLNLREQRNQLSENQQKLTTALAKSRFEEARALQLNRVAGQRLKTLDILTQAVVDYAADRKGFDLDIKRDLRDSIITSLSLDDLEKSREWRPEIDNNLHIPSVDSHHKFIAHYINKFVTVQEFSKGKRAFEQFLGEKVCHGVLLSLDGERLAICIGLDGMDSPDECWMFNFKESQAIWGIKCSGDAVQFSPDGKKFAASLKDGSVNIVDLNTGNTIKQIAPSPSNQGHGALITALAFSPDNQTLAITRKSGSLEIGRWQQSAESTAAWRQLSLPSTVRDLSWSHDGQLFAAGCSNSVVQVWNTANWEPISVLEGHTGPIGRVIFSPTKNLLATSSLDGETRLWEPVLGTTLTSSQGLALAFNPDGQRLAHQIGLQVSFWNIHLSEESRLIAWGRGGNASPRQDQHGSIQAKFHPTEPWLISWGWDGVRIHHGWSGKEIALLPIGPIQNLVFSPKGTTWHTVDSQGVKQWPVSQSRVNTPDGGEEITIRIGPPQTLPISVSKEFENTLAIDKQEQRLVIGSGREKNALQVLALDPVRQPAQNPQLWLDSEPRGQITSVAISPDGTMMARGNAINGKGVQIWSWAGSNGKSPILVAQLDDNLLSGNACSVAFDPTGQVLAVCELNAYRFFNVNDWTQSHRVSRGGFHAKPAPVAWTDDGQIVAVLNHENQLTLLETKNYTETARLHSLETVSLASFSFGSKNRLLAAASNRNSIRIWNLPRIREQLRDVGLECEWGSIPNLSDEELLLAGKKVVRFELLMQ